MRTARDRRSLPQKLPADAKRDVCSRCHVAADGTHAMLAMFTVVDVYGNELVVCGDCWR